VKRFNDFTNLVTKRGALVNQLNKKDISCVWCHCLSQMWFIEMYPLPINYVLHLETLEKDIAELGKRLPIFLPEARLPKMNTKGHLPGELDKTELIRRSPESIEKILKYLLQDYICLDYPQPNVLKLEQAAKSESTTEAAEV
jgi:hypothetical protein